MIPAQRFIILSALLLTTCFIFGHRAPCRADATDMVDLTLEEQAFLKEHPVLRLGVGVAFPPFQYVDDSGESPVFKGMVSDYIALLSERLNVEMKPVYGISFKTALRMGKAKEIDVFPCIADTPERRAFLDYTEPYLSYPLVIVSHDKGPFISGMDDLNGKRLAIAPALANWSKIQNEYPHLNTEFIFEKTVRDVLESVSLGKADACIANLAVLSYMTKKLGLSNLRVAAPTPWGENKLAMAVRNDWPLLAGILQKALASITWQEKNTISERWISLKYDHVTDTATIWKTVLITGGCALLVIAAVMFRNRRLRREIRERARIEETLRRNEEKYRSLIESTDTAFVIMDQEGLIRDANIKFLDLTGRKEFDQVINHPATELFPKAGHEKLAHMLQECLESKFIRDLQVEFVMPDGTLKPVEINGACHSHGDTKEIHALCRDISGRKRAEEMIIHTEKMMSVGGIAAGIAHEVNNPLTSVLGNAQNLVRRIQPGLPANEKAAAEAGVTVEAVREYMRLRGIGDMLESIRESAVKAAKVVSNLLTFSSGNTGGFSICSISDIIDEALELAGADYDLKRKIDFKNIILTREYDPDLLNIRCNPTEIRQVLLNILRNAARAMAGNESAPAVTIRTKLDGDTAVIEILDNGPGMGNETRRRVFEPFFTTHAPNEGTGLGLSVAYFIVARNHQGHIDVDSAPGKGTSFIISLPVEGPSSAANGHGKSSLKPEFFNGKEPFPPPKR